ncbi:hypothetical protein [Nocardioides sp. T2.26MG-1]|uniref:hypothetical protein n=1 Tax=Nocardioides sp. T2.26MG-1 TaxID=3041166 RepID=UPI002477AF9C|nr:hypothetical protein [Nocardioides sp. T2.26MG-1]CAI9398668.1 hypothetical protein HIDPHFAB_00042 [Nocardioides sp. T2.26MG-1]
MSVSLVCVFNDPAVRAQCLDRSLAGIDPDRIELIAVDNVDHRFTTAGAALNHGVRVARHDVVGFVHQDVFVHSAARLLQVAELLRQDSPGSWGMVGAAGVSATGEVLGRLRDRVELVGTSAPSPVDVDSLDEVLFLAPRALLLQHPLSEDRDLAWHAYAVEYGVRLRGLGRRVGAVDLAITHNSLTINLARLAEAHRRVAELHPAATPVRTTCGVVGAASRGWRNTAPVRRHGWRRRALLGSFTARRARLQTGAGRTVLADIRLDVDDVLLGPGERFRVVNLDRGGSFTAFAGEPIELTRRGAPFELSCVSEPAGLVPHFASGARGPLLCTNLTVDDLSELAAAGVIGDETVVGIHDSDVWLLDGVDVERLPASWLTGRAVPFNALRPRMPAPPPYASGAATAASGLRQTGEDGVLR